MRMKRIGVIAKPGSSEPLALARGVIAWLEKRRRKVVLEARTAAALGRDDGLERSEILKDVDLVVVLGGDGTLLSVARLTARHEVPILGVNLGGLGFLTAVAPEEVYSALERVLAGDFEVSRRTRLDARLWRDGRTVSRYLALNDVVINKGALARMIDLAAWVDGESLAVFRADGLIASTPTGSTAYSLSAGGPVVEPEVGILILSPICPHTLTLRPVVVSDRSRIEIEVAATHSDIHMTIDGQEGIALEPGDRIEIRRSRVCAALVRFAPRSHFEVLRTKLRWGGR